MMDKNKLIERTIQELLKSFGMYAQEEYYEDGLVDISQIVFAAEGLIIDPPDHWFLGYGGGPDGPGFETCGGFGLEELFSAKDDEYYDTLDEQFDIACEVVLESLKACANSEEFKAIPKDDNIVFKLVLIDQQSRTLCMIRQDGEFILPPKK